MILPVTAYGHPVLKKVAEEINEDYPDLDEFIENMFETMYASEGIGLAAPQVNRSIRLFIIDATPYSEQLPELTDMKKVFINPYILEKTGKPETMDEGCLSIPNIREDVTREEQITIEYYDRNWELREETYKGMAARIIQHEYDHLEGILFTDRISNLRKTMIKRKLNDISKGNVKVDYKMIFPAKKKVKQLK